MTSKIHFQKSYTGQAARIIKIVVGEATAYALKGHNTGTVFAIGSDRESLVKMANSKALELVN